MRRPTRFLVVSALLASVAGCGSAPDPVGSLEVSPAEIGLPHAGWRRVELAWTMRAPLVDLEGEPRVSLHLVDGAGGILRTFDHALPDDWLPGGEMTYEVPVYQSALGPPLAAGEYGLRAGLYDEAGHRWPLKDDRVATVRVSDPGEGFPEVSFSADWRPTESGADLQILARRWLEGEGALRVRGIEAAGTLWLRVGIPRAHDLQEMVLDAGAAGPTARVRADCSGFEAELTGSGSHTLEVPLGPGSEGPGECRIGLSANYVLVSKDNDERRTIVLENVAWGG